MYHHRRVCLAVGAYEIRVVPLTRPLSILAVLEPNWIWRMSA